MFRIEHPESFLLLIAIPLLAALVWYYLRFWCRSQQWVGSRRVLREVLPGVRFRTVRNKLLLLLAAFFFFIIGLSNPQWGTKKETVEKKTADVIIALDISRSMLAEDLRPNRLERAKRFAEDLITALRSERIGLIVFAGNAYLQMPLTTDYIASLMFVKAVKTSSATTQGTAIGDAIDMAVKAFGPNPVNHSVLVIISDGENHEEGSLEARDQALASGIHIFGIGVGTEEGGYIPVRYGNRNDYLRDKSGELVRSRHMPEMLKEITDKGRGEYFSLEEAEHAIDQIKEEINLLDKVAIEQRSFSEYQSYFQLFIALGLVCIGLMLSIPLQKEKSS